MCLVLQILHISFSHQVRGVIYCDVCIFNALLILFCCLLFRRHCRKQSRLLHHVTIVWSVCLSVCMLPVILVHPAKAVGRNEMPFGRDTYEVLVLVPSNFVLDRGSSPWCEGEIFGVVTFTSLQ